MRYLRYELSLLNLYWSITLRQLVFLLTMSIRPLPPVLAEKAKKELNEDPNRLKDGLQHIKDWIAKQPHLRARTDDQWLIAFLRGCKYSLERTKEKIDLFYTIHSTAPELFRVKRTDPIFDEILNTGTFLILPKTVTPDSPRVTIIRPGKYDADKYSLTDVWSAVGIISKVVLMDDDTTVIAGSVTVLDLEGVTMSHFLQMTPSNMKKLTVFGQDATPLRMKGTHYLNTPTGFETIFNAIKSLLNEKNRSRLYVHNKNYDELYKYVPKDILPAEYGGNGGTEKEIIEYWKNKVNEYATFVDEDQQYGTDESKRSGRPRTAEDMFGAEGSFRKLEFD